MRAKIRQILEECIEQGIDAGYRAAHNYDDEPKDHHILGEIEENIWLEIDQRFDFERNLADELIEGLDALKEQK